MYLFVLYLQSNIRKNVRDKVETEMVAWCARAVCKPKKATELPSYERAIKLFSGTSVQICKPSIGL